MSDLNPTLANKLIALGDDELVLGHRDSLWTGHAPILEEDIALANIAQDELGHAMLWYALLAELRGEGEDYADQLAFARDAADFRNAQMLELPNGDWAFTMTRQYLFDAYENIWLARAVNSSHTPIKDAATKIRREEIYHLRHSSAWMKRLALGTEESHRRTQAALDVLWPLSAQLFVSDDGDADTAAILLNKNETHAAWLALVQPFLHEIGLTTTAIATPPPRNTHTPHLAEMLAEMQRVARADPQADW